jgi:lipopolysaccharide export system permease protein
MNGLDDLIDSLNLYIRQTTAATYGPLLKERIFPYDKSMLGGDSIVYDKSKFRNVSIADSIETLPLRDRANLVIDASNSARIAKGANVVDEQMSKIAITQLYRAHNEWHRKLTLPVSIIVFFLIGAPLGAIIRKGGLAMPVVVSVLFFVIYYVISIAGEKMAKEGTWNAAFGMWFSAIVLLPIALYLTRIATNDSNLFNVDWYRAQFDKAKSYIASLRAKNN